MRWDSRSLEERIRSEARKRQIDLSKYVTAKEAGRILGRSVTAVRSKYDWLEGETLCGRLFVKRNRTEWLARYRAGQVPATDMMGESLASFDVHARNAEIQRQKDEEEEERRRKAEAERPKGFHIDGKIWWDYDANDTWVPTRYALNTLCRTKENLYAMARRGHVRRRLAALPSYQPVDDPPGPGIRWWSGRRRFCYMWSLRDITRYCERRDNSGRLRGRSLNDPDHPFALARVYYLENAAHERKLITCKEAAEILGVARCRVSYLVTKGRLKAYQRIHHRRGVRVWLSEDQVLEYANSPSRLERKNRWQMYRMAADLDPKRVKFERPEADWLWFHKDRLDGSHPVDHGEDYTVRQAARVLGCSKSTVLEKVKSGILPGFKKALRPLDKWNERRWWFIKKDDVHAYKGSISYRRRRRSYLKQFTSWISNEPTFKDGPQQAKE